MWVLYLFPIVVVVALFFSGWLEGILSKCWSQLWCRIKTERGGGEGRRHSDVRMCGESGVWRDRERFASPVWQSRSGSVPAWALCPRGGSVWLALTVALTKRDAQTARDWETQVCQWRGVSEADWQKRFSRHLHVKWPGYDTAGVWGSRKAWVEISWLVLCHQLYYWSQA